MVHRRVKCCAALTYFPIVALLVLVPPRATAAISAGPTIDLPWSQGVDFLGGTVAVLANGSFAIASSRSDLDTHQVQFFSATGDLLPPVLLKPPVGSSEFTLYVGVGSLGTSYFVVWQDYYYSLSQHELRAYRHAFAELYSEKGTPLGSQFLWPSSAVPDFAEYYRFGSAPRWRFLPITYDLLSNVDDGGSPVYRRQLRVAKPDEALQRPPIVLGRPVVSYVEDAAINGSGRFVVDSVQCASYPPPVTPCVRGIQIFHDAMRPLTPFLAAGIEQDGSSASAAINAQGQVLLNWLDVRGFVARLYDQNGSPASDEIQVDTAREPYEAYVGEMKGLDDGSFVLAWIGSARVGAYGEALVVDRFDPQTRTFEEPVVIATTSYNFRNAVLKLNGDGRGVVVWESQDVGGGPPDFGQFSGHLRVITVTP